MDMIELAERCERGSGADRELDFEVGLASGFWKLVEPAEDGTRLVTYMHPRYQTTWHGAIGACIPELTASLDASVALLERVLPGWGYMLRRHETPHNIRSCASLLSPSGSDAGDTFDVWAQTPARALLAATLRALAVKEPS